MKPGSGRLPPIPSPRHTDVTAVTVDQGDHAESSTQPQHGREDGTAGLDAAGHSNPAGGTGQQSIDVPSAGQASRQHPMATENQRGSRRVRFKAGALAVSAARPRQHSITMKRFRSPQVAPATKGSEDPLDVAIRHGHQTAVKSANRLDLTTRNAYFILIGLSWPRLLALTVFLYLTSALVFALLLLPLEADVLSGDGLTDYPPFEKVLYCSLSSMISLGFGDAIPTSSAATAICIFEQFYAFILGAVIISLILSKFQQPLEDLIFSNKVLLTTRDFKPVMLLRIGNLRCNRIYLPEIRVTHAEPNVTAEGEPFFKFTPLKVDFIPPSIAGCFTVCISLENAELPSDIKGIAAGLAAGEAPHELPAGCAITVVLRGLDSVLGAEITAFHRYGHTDVVVGRRQFVDVMDAHARIDFGRFHQTTTHQLKFDRPAMVDGVIYLLNGAVPYRGEMIKSCMYSQKVEMLMRVGGVAHTIVPINFTRKPAWFLAEVPDGTTPVVIYNGRTIQGSGTILAWVQDTFKSNYTTIPTAPTPQALAATNEVTCAMENWIDKRPDSDQWVSAQTEFTTAVCHLETALFSQDYFCGSALGVEDAMFFPQFESAIQYVELLFKFDLGPVSQALVAYRQRMYATAAWQAICPPLPLLKRIRCERLCGKLAKNCPWLQTIAAGVKGDSNPLSEETDPDEQTERTRLTVDLCM